MSRSLALAALSGALLLAPLAVGCGSEGGGAAQSAPRGPVERYAAYLEAEAQELVDRVGPLMSAIKKGERTRAESRYATARVPYSHVEALAQSFPGSDRLVNPPPAGPGTDFGGFHRIERGLFAERSLAGLVPPARRLFADVKALRRRIEGISLQPERIARDASRLLDETSTLKVSGREERYADMDLVDVAANLEAAEQAFEALEPGLADRGLAKAIEARFRRAYALVEEYGTLARDPEQWRPEAPGVSFVVYSEVSSAERRALRERFAALAALFRQLPAQVAG